MELFERFLQERVYLRNISPATVRYYRSCWTALGSHIDLLNVKNSLLERVCALKDKGLKPTSINDYLRGCKAFLNWCHEEGHLKEKPSVRMLRTERKILTTLDDTMVAKVIGFKPTCAHSTNLVRVKLIALTILDTGLRASEVLALTTENTDMDNLVIKVLGKGGKHRMIPFSFELRKSLWKFMQRRETTLIFGTKNNTKVSVRNLNRDFKVLGKQCGIPHIHPHLLRHTFACNWIRRGGDLFLLSKCLGHSSVSTTQVYLRSIGIADLSAAHSRLSLLSQHHSTSYKRPW